MAVHAVGGVFIHVMYRERERERQREHGYGNMVGGTIKNCYPRRPHILTVEGVEPWQPPTFPQKWTFGTFDFRARSLPILGLKTNPSREEKQGSYQHLNMPRGPRWGGARRVCWSLWPLGEKPGPWWAASNSTRIGWCEQAIEVGVWGPWERN